MALPRDLCDNVMAVPGSAFLGWAGFGKALGGREGLGQVNIAIFWG